MLQFSQKKELNIKFAGDSGDGIQLIGTRFAHDSLLKGLTLFTFPDFPAEIRAPQGSISGVSGFQLRISSTPIHSAGEKYDILIALNAAALSNELRKLRKDGLLIVDENGFTNRHLNLAKFSSNPIEDEELTNKYQLIKLPITQLTRSTLASSRLTMRERDRARNMFTLGLLYYIFDYDLAQPLDFLKQKFSKKPEILEANSKVLRAGFQQGEILDIIPRFQVENKSCPSPGIYRNISGNSALAYGLISASKQNSLPLFLASYPITPASEILHQLSNLKNFGVKTFQAEDEIAAICAAIGAAYAGALGVTSTSGPGMDLKTEGLGLACILEIPLIIINVQRAGPSTGMPTKVEQSDLLQAYFGRHGESPIPILAPATPSEAFNIAYEACRLAVEFMTPVILLSDANIGNGMESWKIPNIEELPKFEIQKTPVNKGDFQPYCRNDKGARAWILPGTTGLEHRLGSLEKDAITGSPSYDGINHEQMVNIRSLKIARISEYIPEAKVEDENSNFYSNNNILLVGWGSSYGVLHEATEKLNHQDNRCSHLHIRYLNPFPRNLDKIFAKYKHIIVAEINSGQLLFLLRGKYSNFNFQGYNELKGGPLSLEKLCEFLQQYIISRS